MQTDPAPVSAALRQRRGLGWALLGALGLAALYAHVTVLNLTQGVVGGDIDGYENLWNTWWLHKALFDLHQNPFINNYIYYPTGVQFYFHTFNPISGLLILPLNLTLGYIPAINLLILGLLTAATLFAFLFLRDWVGNPWAAFAGAALFTYGHRLVVEYYLAGQTERLSVEWFPLYLFCLFRALFGVPSGAPGDAARIPEGRRRWLRWAVPAALTLVAMSLADWQYVMITVFTTLLLFAFLMLTRRSWLAKRLIFGKLALIGGLYTVLILPLLWLTVQNALANPWLSVGYQSELHATDLLDLLGPGPANPGYLALAAAGWGLWTARRGPERTVVVFWALATLAFYLMAFGPQLTVGGQKTGLPLPYAVLQNLPVFSIGRDPARYTLVPRLGIGLLAAYGLRALFAWAQAQPWGRWVRGGTAGRVACAAVLVAFLALNLGGFALAAGGAAINPPEWSPFFQQVAADPTPYALLELPLFTEKGRGEDHYQLYQVVHGKPRLGGRYARDHKLTNPDNFVKTAGLFRDLWLLDSSAARRAAAYPAQDFLPRTDYATQGLAILNYYHVGYIVVYKAALSSDWHEATFQHILTQILGPDVQPTYEDGLLRAYKVPAGPPAADPLTLDTGDGWYPPEADAAGPFRWADRSPAIRDGAARAGDLYTLNLTQQPLAVTLHALVFAFKEPRRVEVRLNDTLLTTLTVVPSSGPQTLDLPLTLPPGRNTLAFSSPAPPLATGDPQDARLLSFGLRAIRLARP